MKAIWMLNLTYVYAILLDVPHSQPECQTRSQNVENAVKCSKFASKSEIQLTEKMEWDKLQKCHIHPLRPYLMLIWKSTRRSELRSEVSSTSSAEPEDASSGLHAQYQQRLKSLFDVAHDSSEKAAATSTPEGSETVENTEDAAAYDFHLFSAKQTHASVQRMNAPSKVELRSPEPSNGEPSFLLPRRPDSYYFSGEVSEKKAQEYQYAAITPEDMMKNAAIKWVRFWR